MYDCYCSNRVLCKHADSQMLMRLENAWRRVQMAEEFLPAPIELADGDQLKHWRVEHWGVVEDFGGRGNAPPPIRSGDSLELRFTTFGDLPYPYYAELTRLGYEIDVMFLETFIPYDGIESDRTVFCGRINKTGRSRLEVKCRAPECLRRFIEDEDILRSFDGLSHAFEDWDDEELQWWDCCCNPKDTSWDWPFWPDSSFTRDDLERAVAQAVESGKPHDQRIAFEILPRVVTHEELLAMCEPRNRMARVKLHDGDATNG